MPAGTQYCADSYTGHSNWFGSSPSSWVVDINFPGDKGTTLVAPGPGSVTQVTSGYGGGYGNSIVWTSQDGSERLHLAHLSSVATTGSVAAGTPIGVLGTTGDSSSEHLHLSRSLNGSPAPVILSGVTVTPFMDPVVYGRWPCNGTTYTAVASNSDRDGDGVSDASDRCPDQPGPANTGGCPDTDGDTVADLDDTCPHYPDRRDPHGCPAEGTSAGVSDFNGDGIGDVAGVYEYPGGNPSVRIHLFAGRRSGAVTGPSVFWQTDGTWSGDRARFVSGFSAPAQDPVPAAPEPVPAAPTPSCRTGMPALRVHASGANRRSKLHIDVDPDTMNRAIRVTVLRKRHGRWHHAKKLSLRGRDHQIIINLRGGKYRVTAPTQFGLCPSRSRTVTLRR